MTTGEAAYLSMAIIGALVFMATLAWGAYITPSINRSRGGVKDAPATRSHDHGMPSAAASR